MKNKSGFAPIVLLIIVGVVLVAGSAYYLGGRTKVDPLESELTDDQQATSSPTSTEGTKYPEDGNFTGYITKAYDKDSKKYIDIDYFVTLWEKAAVLKRLDTPLSNNCFAKYPTPTKATILAEINNLKDDSTFNEQFRLLSNQNDGVACFPDFSNGIWLDSNDNPKIRTFEANLNKLIRVSYVREEFGLHKISTSGDAGLYEVTWDTFKNIISGVSYKIPFRIIVSENKIVEITEIYRP